MFLRVWDVASVPLGSLPFSWMPARCSAPPPSLPPPSLGADAHAHPLPDELESLLALGHLEQLHGEPLNHFLQELGVVVEMPKAPGRPEAPGRPCLLSSLPFGPHGGPKP